jgi:hypothetical protein
LCFVGRSDSVSILYLSEEIKEEQQKYGEYRKLATIVPGSIIAI